MPSFFYFLLIAALGNTAYHIGQKALHDQTGNPMLILIVYYLLAGLMCLLAMPWFGPTHLTDLTALIGNWRVWVVAIGIILIELGFLLAYHAGGSVQWGGVAVNGIAALLLIPLGIWLFREHFSWTKLGGMVLTLAGLYFLVKK